MTYQRYFHAACLFLMALTLYPAGAAWAQYYRVEYALQTYTSLSVPIAPRSMALGEAMVALPGAGEPLIGNPAGLAARHGIWADYDHQSSYLRNLLTDDARFRSWSLGVSTPYGVFGLSYRRFDQGELPDVVLVDPVGSMSPGRLSLMPDYTAGLAWGYAVGDAVHLGVAFKTYSMASTNRERTDIRRPYLFDLGFIYNVPFAGEKGDHTFSFGAALENFGTDYRVSSTLISAAPSGVRPTMIETTTIQPVPRTLRVGISYQYSLQKPSADLLNPLHLALTGEVRTILNERAFRDRTFWGLGLEATAFEVLTGRIGGLAYPSGGIFSEEHSLGFRFGAEVRLPLARAFPMVPFTLTGSYSSMTLHGQSWVFGASLRPKSIDAFSIGLQYDAEAFQ